MPLEPSLVADWLIARVLEYLKNAGGTEVFTETGQEGTITLLCGGKMLVIEVGLRRSDEEVPRLEVVDAKAQHSHGDEGAVPQNRSPRDLLLLRSLSEYVAEGQKSTPDVKKVAKLGRTFQSHVELLMTFDALANAEAAAGKTNGDRWFKEAEVTEAIVRELAGREAKALTRYAFE